MKEEAPYLREREGGGLGRVDGLVDLALGGRLGVGRKEGGAFGGSGRHGFATGGLVETERMEEGGGLGVGRWEQADEARSLGWPMPGSLVIIDHQLRHVRVTPAARP